MAVDKFSGEITELRIQLEAKEQELVQQRVTWQIKFLSAKNHF